jgi:hypothetical protein
MPGIEFDGQRYEVPGVVRKTLVSSSAPGPLPAFHVPILLGAGWDGHPYDVGDKLVDGEADPSPFKRCNTDSVLSEHYGAGTELHRGMRFAKRHGLPFAFVCNLSDMVRASIVAETAAPVAQFTMHARKFGPMGGWHKIGYASSILTIIPVKRFAPLIANLGSSATRAYVEGAGIHGWLVEGASVVVGSNSVAGVVRTILSAGVEITSTGQRRHWVELSSAPGSAVNTSAYGVILQYATEKTYTVSGMATAQNLIDYLNSFDPLYRAVVHANFTNAAPDAIATPTPLKEITAWGTVIAGTAPAPTDADVDAFIAMMNAGEWAEFAETRQLVPQTYCLLSGDSSQHAAMRDYAAAERTRGFPISVMVGGRWGDIVLAAGDDTDPLFRASSLNSDSVALAICGLDREAAYLSLAPALWGIRVARGPGHNLTNDDLIFSELEVLWDEINSGELSDLTRSGCITLKLKIGQTIRYSVNQGTSTLQANAVIWNSSDATTWALMQRDLADFIDRVIHTDFEEGFVGADVVTANGIAAALRRRAFVSLVKRNYLKPDNGFRIDSISLNDEGNGFLVEWSVRLPDTIDFITVKTTILVGEA